MAASESLSLLKAWWAQPWQDPEAPAHTESSWSLISLLSLSWLLRYRFSINVCWALNIPGREGSSWPHYHTAWSPTSEAVLLKFLLQKSLIWISFKNHLSTTPTRKLTAPWFQVFMKVTMVVGFEFSMGTASLHFHAFFPFTSLDSGILN